jgi:hypothetical protein
LGIVHLARKNFWPEARRKGKVARQRRYSTCALQAMNPAHCAVRIGVKLERCDVLQLVEGLDARLVVGICNDFSIRLEGKRESSGPRRARNGASASIRELSLVGFVDAASRFTAPSNSPGRRRKKKPIHDLQRGHGTTRRVYRVMSLSRKMFLRRVEVRFSLRGFRLENGQENVH